MLHSQATETHCASEGKNRGSFKFSSHSVLTREWQSLERKPQTAHSACFLAPVQLHAPSLSPQPAELWHNLTHFFPQAFLCPSLWQNQELDLVCLALPQTCECGFESENMNMNENGFILASETFSFHSIFWPFTWHRSSWPALRKVGNLSEDSKIGNAQKCD